MKQLNCCFYIAIILFFSPILYAKTHIITIENNYFNRPDQLNILVGDTIRFENVSNNPLTLNFERMSAMGYPIFDSGILNPGNAFEHTFTHEDGFYYTDASSSVQPGSIRIYEKPLIISPGDSMLLGKKEFSVTIFYPVVPTLPTIPAVFPANGLHSHISLILDKKIIYDGDFNTFLKSTLVSEVGGTGAGLLYFVITVPKNSLALGRHTFQVQSKDSSILYDEVHYTVK